jgi:papain fold toxin 1 (glutamine deamidase) of polymorphic toxin system
MGEAELITDLGVFRSVALLFRASRRMASTPGREFRPAEVEALTSGKLSRQEMKILQQSHATIESALRNMPGGVPRSVGDVRTVLPHINPLGFANNCAESSMAVDDVLAGRPAVAGNSRLTDVLPDRLGGKPEFTADDSPTSIEHELLRAGAGSRGVVLMGSKDGRLHTANVANLEGETYWIDGQISGLVSKEKGEDSPFIVPRYPYDALNQGFDFHVLIRTDRATS